MKKFKTFRCAECGKYVRLATGTGRTRRIKKGEYVRIPDYFLIPTCRGCGETYMMPEYCEPIDKYIEILQIRNKGKCK